jgi:sugar (pentulose or hexulose) kinase
MPGAAAHSTIAVLDVGKSNLKLLVASDDGWPIETLSIPNAATTSDRYLGYDLAALEAWLLDALTDVARRHSIGAVVATAHGCSAVLTDGQSAVLPMMDYEALSPPEIDRAYERLAPPYTEVFCSNGSGAMRLAKQLLWQQTAFPIEFARASSYLTTAQYVAMRLGGRAASEISQLAAQGHIWDAIARRPSSIMRARGWDRLLPAREAAGAVLGTVSEAVSRRTGLSPATEILCGAHDSNANLFRYKAAGLGEASVLSTGTWMIGFNRGLDPVQLDPDRAMVLNVDVDGENVPSTLTMTGREYDLIRRDHIADDAAVLAAIPRLCSQRTLAVPSFVGDDGLFPGAGRRGRITGPPPLDPSEWQALAALYAAFTACKCLDALGSTGHIVIDGGFAANVPFARALATLRSGQRVSRSQSRDGTALGAALLWKRSSRTAPVSSVVLDDAAALDDLAERTQLFEAYQSWTAQSEQSP